MKVVVFLLFMSIVWALDPIECRKDIKDPRCNWTWTFVTASRMLNARRVDSGTRCQVLTGPFRIVSKPFVATNGKWWNFDPFTLFVIVQIPSGQEVSTICPRDKDLEMEMTGTTGIFILSDVPPGYSFLVSRLILF
jgi:hypothetical protein